MVGLYKAVDLVDLRNFSHIQAIMEALEDRYETLEGQEPFGNSDFFYEKWEEKFSEFEYLKDDFESLVEDFRELLLDDNEEEREEIDKEKFKQLKSQYKSWVRNVKMYQLDYGGLKRVKVGSLFFRRKDKYV